MRWIDSDGVSAEYLDFLDKDLKLLLDHTEACVEPRQGLPHSLVDKKNDIALIVKYIFDNCGKSILSEKEFTTCMAMFVTDPVEARRWAADFGLVERTADGSRYRLI